MSAVALGFVGDVCLGGGMRAALVRNGPAKFFELAQPLFADRDLICGNLECCLVEDSGKWITEESHAGATSFGYGTRTFGYRHMEFIQQPRNGRWRRRSSHDDAFP